MSKFDRKNTWLCQKYILYFFPVETGQHKVIVTLHTGVHSSSGQDLKFLGQSMPYKYFNETDFLYVQTTLLGWHDNHLAGCQINCHSHPELCPIETCQEHFTS